MQRKQLLIKFKFSPKTARIFFGALAIAAVMFASLYLFQVKKIELINGETYVPLNSRYLQLNGLLAINDENILFLPKRDIEKRLYSINPVIKKITIEKKLPNTLKLFIIPNIPKANLQVYGGYFVLGDNGRILNRIKQAQNQLPVIHYYQKLNMTNYHVGDWVDFQDVLHAMAILNKAVDLGMQIDSIDISGSNMIALYSKDRKLLFSAENNVNTETYEMETIIKRFKIEGKDFTVLDLRFDKPILQLK